jgi:hypothetical protein
MILRLIDSVLIPAMQTRGTRTAGHAMLEDCGVAPASDLRSGHQTVAETPRAVLPSEFVPWPEMEEALNVISLWVVLRKTSCLVMQKKSDTHKPPSERSALELGNGSVCAL